MERVEGGVHGLTALTAGAIKSADNNSGQCEKRSHEAAQRQLYKGTTGG